MKAKYLVKHYYTSYVAVEVEVEEGTPVKEVKEQANLLIDDMSDEEYKDQLFNNRESDTIEVWPMK